MDKASISFQKWITDDAVLKAGRFDSRMKTLEQVIDEESDNGIPNQERINAAAAALSSAALELQNLSPNKNDPTTAQDLDHRLNPWINSQIKNYQATGDPRALNTLKQRLLMGNRQRKLDAEIEMRTQGLDNTARGFVAATLAGPQELLSEGLSTSAMFLTGGAGALAKTAVMARIGIAARAATLTERVAAGVLKFENIGMKVGTLAKPLSRLEKARNFGVKTAKVMGVGTAVENMEEIVLLPGEDSPDLWQTVKSTTAGMMVMLPVQAGIVKAGEKVIGSFSDMRDNAALQKFADEYNAQFVSTPGFVSITAKTARAARQFVSPQQTKADLQRIAELTQKYQLTDEEQASTGKIVTNDRLDKLNASKAKLQERLAAGGLTETQQANTQKSLDQLQQRIDQHSTGMRSAGKQLLFLEMQQAALRIAARDQAAVDAATAIQAIPFAERARYTGLAKVAAGNIASLTREETKAIQGLKTENGKDVSYFEPVLDDKGNQVIENKHTKTPAERISAAGLEEIENAVPALAHLIRTTAKIGDMQAAQGVVATDDASDFKETAPERMVQLADEREKLSALESSPERYYRIHQIDQEMRMGHVHDGGRVASGKLLERMARNRLKHLEEKQNKDVPEAVLPDGTKVPGQKNAKASLTAAEESERAKLDALLNGQGDVDHQAIADEFGYVLKPEKKAQTQAPAAATPAATPSQQQQTPVNLTPEKLGIFAKMEESQYEALRLSEPELNLPELPALVAAARAAGLPVHPSMEKHAPATPATPAVKATSHLGKDDQFSRDWTPKEVQEVNDELGEQSPFTPTNAAQIVNDEVNSFGEIDDALVQAAGMSKSMPADWHKVGRKWVAKDAAPIRYTYTEQHVKIATNIANSIKKRAEQALKEIVIHIETNEEIRVSGGVSTNPDGSINLVIPDIAAQLTLVAPADVLAFSDILLQMVIHHEGGHTAQFNVAKSEFEEALKNGYLGTFEQFVKSKYLALLDDYKKNGGKILEIAKQIYDNGKPIKAAGYSEWDQIPDWQKVMEAERILLEYVIGQNNNAALNSEFERAKVINPEYLVNFEKVLKQLAEWLKKLINNATDKGVVTAAKENLDKVVAAYEKLAGMEEKNSSKSSITPGVNSVPELDQRGDEVKQMVKKLTNAGVDIIFVKDRAELKKMFGGEESNRTTVPNAAALKLSNGKVVVVLYPNALKQNDAGILTTLKHERIHVEQYAFEDTPEGAKLALKAQEEFDPNSPNFDRTQDKKMRKIYPSWDKLSPVSKVREASRAELQALMDGETSEIKPGLFSYFKGFLDHCKKVFAGDTAMGELLRELMTRLDASEEAPVVPVIGKPIGQAKTTAPEGTVVSADLELGAELLTRRGDAWYSQDGNSVNVPSNAVVVSVPDTVDDLQQDGFRAVTEEDGTVSIYHGDNLLEDNLTPEAAQVEIEKLKAAATSPQAIVARAWEQAGIDFGLTKEESDLLGLASDDFIDALQEIPADKRQAFTEQEIRDWVESSRAEAEAKKQAEEEAKMPQSERQRRARLARESRINANALDIINSGNYPVMEAMYQRGKLAPKPRLLALIIAKAKKGAKLTEREMEISRNSSDWDGAPLKYHYTGGWQNVLIRAVLGHLMAREGKGLKPNVMADELRPGMTTASEMFEALAKEFRALAKGKLTDDSLDNPDHVWTDEEIDAELARTPKAEVTPLQQRERFNAANETQIGDEYGVDELAAMKGDTVTIDGVPMRIVSVSMDSLGADVKSVTLIEEGGGNRFGEQTVHAGDSVFGTMAASEQAEPAAPQLTLEDVSAGIDEHLGSDSQLAKKIAPFTVNQNKFTPQDRVMFANAFAAELGRLKAGEVSYERWQEQTAGWTEELKKLHTAVVKHTPESLSKWISSLPVIEEQGGGALFSSPTQGMHFDRNTITKATASAKKIVASSTPETLTRIGRQWKTYAEKDDAFKVGRNLTAKTVEELVKQQPIPLTVTALGHVPHPSSIGSVDSWELSNKAGRSFILSKGRMVWIDTSATGGTETYKHPEKRSKAGAGPAVYQIAQAFARNNKWRFIPDPEGVSEIAAPRRWAHMLSSILRFGDAAHLDPADMKGNLEVPSWSDSASTEEQIGRLAMAEYGYVKSWFPEIESLQISPDFTTISDSNGRLLGNNTERAFRDFLQGRRDPRVTGIGETTLLRALITRQTISASTASGRNNLQVRPFHQNGMPSGDSGRNENATAFHGRGGRRNEGNDSLLEGVLYSSPAQNNGEFSFNQTTDAGDANQKGFNFNSLPEPPASKFHENVRKEVEKAPAGSARQDQIAARVAQHEGIKDVKGFVNAGKQASFDFGTTGSFDTKKQLGFDFTGKPVTPQAEEQRKPAKKAKQPWEITREEWRDMPQGSETGEGWNAFNRAIMAKATFEQAQESAKRTMSAESQTQTAPESPETPSALGKDSDTGTVNPWDNTEIDIPKSLQKKGIWDLYEMDSKIEQASQPMRFNNQVGQKDYRGVEFTPESVMGELFSAEESMRSMDGRLLSQQSRGASTRELVESWLKAEQIKTLIRQQRESNPEIWNAYDERQKAVQRLDVGDTVLTQYANPENPVGSPAKIIRKFSKNWKVEADGREMLLHPSTLRPAITPVSTLKPDSVSPQPGTPDFRLLPYEAKKAIADNIKQAKREAFAAKKAGITDFGEKLGGARKDLSIKTGESARPKKTNDKPGWFNRYEVNEVVAEVKPTGPLEAYWANSASTRGINTGSETGRFVINDKRKTDWKGNPIRATRETFATREEAEAAIPMIEVSRNHRVRKGEDLKYGIWRTVTDRKVVQVVMQSFETENEAREFMAKHASDIIETKTSWREELIVKPEKAVRKGPERRSGPATSEMFQSAFGFRGVEFGNWMRQAGDGKERQEVLNHAYDGLLDLADTLGIPPLAISLNGELGLAFGARGQGLSGAKAHYEPDYVVINLTKMSGAGSLAHEWIHALDHYLGRQDGRASSQLVKNKLGDMVLKTVDFENNAVSSRFSKDSKVREEVRAAFTRLMDSIMTKAVEYVEDSNKAETFVAASRKALEDHLARIRKEYLREPDARYEKRRKQADTAQIALFDSIADRLINGQDLANEWRGVESNAKYGKTYRWTNDTLEQLGVLHKQITNRSGFSKERNGWLDDLQGYMSRYEQRIKMLESAAASETKIKKVPTDFSMNAKRIDQGSASDYWNTPHEMLARAFSAYVEDRISATGGTSDFLSYGSDNSLAKYRDFNVKPFPEGVERERINQAFNKLFSEIQTEETDKGMRLFSSPAQNSFSREKADILKTAPRDKAGKLLAPNGRRSNLTEDQWATVRTKNFLRWFGDWHRMEVERLVFNQSPTEIRIPKELETLTTDELRDLIETALLSLAESGQPLIHPEIREVSISKGTGVKKIINASRDPAKLFIAGDLRNAFAASRLLEEAPAEGYGQNVVAFEKLLGRVQVAGRNLAAIYTVRRLKDGRQFYNTVALEEMTPAVSPGDTPASGERATPAYAEVGQHIRQRYQLVNPETVSKAIDENGEPLVAFHGGRIFDSFNESPAAGAHYASTDIEAAQTFADQYGKGDSEVKPLFLNIRNPLLAEEMQRSGSGEISAAKEAGHDGIEAQDTDAYERGQYQSFAFWDSNQAKSAGADFGSVWGTPVKQQANNGDFSEDPSTLMSSPVNEPSPEQPDLFTAATAPDAGKRLGGVKVGNMNALSAYRALTAKRNAGKALSTKEEQQLLDAEVALGQKLAFDMDGVKTAPTADEIERNNPDNIKNRIFAKPSTIRGRFDFGFRGADGRIYPSNGWPTPVAPPWKAITREEVDKHLTNGETGKGNAELNGWVLRDMIKAAESTERQWLKMEGEIESEYPNGKQTQRPEFGKRGIGGQDEMFLTGGTAPQEKTGQMRLFSSPSQSKAVQIALASMRPLFVQVFEAVQDGATPEEIVNRFPEVPNVKAVNNILNQVRARITVAIAAEADNLKPAMKDGKIDGGRPDLSYGADPMMAAIDQTRNESEIPDVLTREVVVNEAEKRLRLNYDGEYQNLLNAAREGRGLSTFETAMAKLIMGREAIKGNIATADDRMKLGMLGYGWREVGTEQGRSLAMRFDPFNTPAERNAQIIAENLTTPDAKTRKRMRKNPKNAEEILAGWMKVSDAIESELKMQGIDIRAALEEFRASQEELKQASAESPQAASVIETQIRKLSRIEKSVIEAIRSGALVTKAAMLTGLSNAKVIEINDRFVGDVKAAMAESARRYIESVLGSSPAGDMMDQILAQFGIYDSRFIDDTQKGFKDRRKEVKAGPRKQAPPKPKEPKQEKPTYPEGLTPEQIAKLDAAWERFQNAKPSDWATLWQEEAKNLTPILGAVGFANWKGQALKPWRDLWQTEMEAITNPQSRITFDEWIAKPANVEKFRPERDLFPLPINETTGTFDLHDPVAMLHVIEAFAMARGSKMDAFMEYRKMSILSGQQTHNVNISSTALNMAFHLVPRRLVEATVNTIMRSEKSATFGEFKPMVYQIVNAWHLAARLAMNSWKLDWVGASLFEEYAQAKTLQFDLTGNATIDRRMPANGGKFGKAMRSISFRELQTADVFLKSFYGQIEAAAQAHRIAAVEEKLKGDAYDKRLAELMEPGSIAWVRSMDKTRYVAFQKDLAFEGLSVDAVRDKAEETPILDIVVDGLLSLLNVGIGKPVIGRVLDWFMPFKTTPANINKQAIGYTPAGAVLDLVDAARTLRRRIFRGGISKQEANAEAAKLYDRARAVNDVTNQIVGMVALAAVAQLAIPGDDDDGDGVYDYDDLPQISGTTSYTYTKRGERDNAYAVMPPMSLRLPFGVFLSYSKFEPFSSSIASMVDFVVARHKHGGITPAAMAEWSSKSLDRLAEQSFMRGFSEFYNAVRDPDRFGERLISGAAISLVPNFIRQPIREADKTMRNASPREEDGFFMSFAKSVGYGLVPQIAPVKQSFLGYDIPSNRGDLIGGTRVIDLPFRVLDPTNLVVNPKIHPLERWVYLWNLKTADSKYKVAPQSIDDKISVRVPGEDKDRKVGLTVEEQHEANRQAGQMIIEYLGDGWDKMPLTKENAKLFNDTVSKAQSDVRKELEWKKLDEITGAMK